MWERLVFVACPFGKEGRLRRRCPQLNFVPGSTRPANGLPPNWAALSTETGHKVTQEQLWSTAEDVVFLIGSEQQIDLIYVHLRR